MTASTVMTLKKVVRELKQLRTLEHRKGAAFRCCCRCCRR